MHKAYSGSSGRIRIVALSLALAFIPLWLGADAPAWWAEQGVLDTTPGVVVDDYAVVNQGQVKHIAQQAYEEMKARGVIDPVAAEASTNPDDPAHKLFVAWEAPAAGTDDYAAVNLGQLKYVAEPFYDHLAITYPWLGSAGVADDFALANIGQVKNLFSFIIPDSSVDPVDTDGNGLPDSWEIEHFGMVGVSPVIDSDGDGVSNLAEYNAGSDPLSPSNSSVLLTLFAPSVR